MTAPPVGAGPLRLTVFPVAAVPPAIAVAVILTADSTGGLMVSSACLLAPLYDAVMVTDVGVATGVVVMANVADVAPAAMVTEAGTAAISGLLLFSATLTPPAGAVPLRTTL